MLNTYREIALLNFISQDACGNCGFCQRNTGNILQNKKNRRFVCLLQKELMCSSFLRNRALMCRFFWNGL